MATKSIKITIRYAQARRIACEHCGERHTFVAGGTVSGFESDSAAFADDNELRRAAFRSAANDLEKIGENEFSGRGRCPSCHHLQGWMRVSAGTAIATFVVVALVAAGLVGFAVTYFASQMVAAIVGGVVAVLGVALGVVFGKRAGDSDLQPGKEADPFVKTDAALLEYIHESLGSGEDPFLRWWKAADKPIISGREKNTTEYSMGLWDLTEPALELPESLTSKARASALIRMDA